MEVGQVEGTLEAIHAKGHLTAWKQLKGRGGGKREPLKQFIQLATSPRGGNSLEEGKEEGSHGRNSCCRPPRRMEATHGERGGRGPWKQLMQGATAPHGTNSWEGVVGAPWCTLVLAYPPSPLLPTTNVRRRSLSRKRMEWWG